MLLSLCLVLFVSACGGDAGTRTVFYNYTPPRAPGGRLCIDQCGKSRDYCQQSCGFDYRGCYNEMQASAQKDYDRYAAERYAAHLPLDRNPSDFEKNAVCRDSRKRCLADCDLPYNSCYSSCGGAVASSSSCQFLCPGK